MDWSRAWRHLVSSHGEARKLFSPDVMARLHAVITEGEATHRGEVRLIVESSLPLRKIRRGLGTRQRALDVFGTFRVWDTEENNGVLLYINVADHKLEIVADRAAARLIGDPTWRTIAATAERSFREGQFERGVAEALHGIQRALETAFPLEGGRPVNELPDQPVLLA